jgi:hypothetical protein
MYSKEKINTLMQQYFDKPNYWTIYIEKLLEITQSNGTKQG